MNKPSSKPRDNRKDREREKEKEKSKPKSKDDKNLKKKIISIKSSVYVAMVLLVSCFKVKFYTQGRPLL
jgi:hypothetical protein